MRWVWAGVAALAIASGVGNANAQILGFGGDREVVSVLGQVRANEFAERCSQPVGEVEGEAAEAYDLVDMLAGAPDGARYNVNYAGSQRTDARLNEMLQSFVAVQAPPAGVTVTVHVEDTADVDARQSSAGQILITAGLINALQDRPELPQAQRTADLAFILAHEYSHVLLCHYNRSVTVSRNRRALRSASAIGLLAVTLSNSSVTRTASGMTVNTDGQAVGQDYLAVMAGLTVLRTFNSSIVNPAWSRQQERDADRLAVELMAEAGQPTIYVEQLLTSLHAADEETTNSFSQLAGQLPGQAMSALALSFGQQNQGRSFRDMLTVSVAGAGIQAFQQWRANQLRHFHDPPERRVNWIRPVLELRNAEQRQIDEARVIERSPFNEAWADGLDSDVDADMRAPQLADEANRLFAASDYEGGCNMATQALAADRTSLDALMVCGQCEIHRNDVARAQRHFTAVEGSRWATPDHFQNVATLWMEAEQRPRAELTLNAGASRYPERFYTPRMYMHQRYGELDRVQAVAAECAAANIPQPIKDECARTAREIAQAAAAPAEQPAQTGFNPLNALVPGRN